MYSNLQKEVAKQLIILLKKKAQIFVKLPI